MDERIEILKVQFVNKNKDQMDIEVLKNTIANISNFTDDFNRLDIVKERIGELKYKSKEKIHMRYRGQWGVMA